MKLDALRNLPSDAHTVLCDGFSSFRGRTLESDVPLGYSDMGQLDARIWRGSQLSIGIDLRSRELSCWGVLNGSSD